MTSSRSDDVIILTSDSERALSITYSSIIKIKHIHYVLYISSWKSVSDVLWRHQRVMMSSFWHKNRWVQSRLSIDAAHRGSRISIDSKTAGGVQNFKKMRYGGFEEMHPRSPIAWAYQCNMGPSPRWVLLIPILTGLRTSPLRGDVRWTDNPRKSLISTLIHPFF